MSSTAHSHVGASSAYRWMACPGSVRLCKTVPNVASRYAMEGTVAHTLGEECLNKNRPAAFFIGQVIQTPIDCITIDDEMAENVQIYVDAVNADCEPGDVIAIEERFNLDAFFPGMFGTNDCSIYRPSTGLLRVYDLKYGAGVPVDVEDNPQLKYYALGAATAVPGRKLSSVELVIVQPRCQHKDGPVRRWTTTAVELVDWAADLIDAAKATEAPDAPLRQGSHCRFCSASAICPKMREAVLATAKMDFEDSNHSETKNPKPPESMTQDELAEVLAMADVIDTWLTAVRAFGHREAEAGRPPTGFKLVAKQSRRYWVEHENVPESLASMGLSWEEIHAPSVVKSPAQIEAVLKKQKKDIKTIAPLWVSRSSGTALVHESNSRPAVKSSAFEDFK